MAELKNLKNATTTKEETKHRSHIPPTQTADTLFNFMSERKFLETIIENKKISARYCKEDLRYLKIKFKEIAFPMKCFCDINMHKMGEHLKFYGFYGIAFSKAWGMRKGIQPLQYINPDSILCNNFRLAFNNALRINDKSSEKLRDYLAIQLMFLKPYSGKFKNRVTKRNQRKCFTDECEWRFVADVSKLKMEEIITSSSKMQDGVLSMLSNALEGQTCASLDFEYEDIKYIILKDVDDYENFLNFITKLKKVSDADKYLLVSKIIIWSEIEGDL